MNIPGMEKPIQPLDVLYTGAYAQDEWRPRSNLTVTGGVRVRRADVRRHRLSTTRSPTR